MHCRASSGHSDFGFARPAELCNILFPNMSDRLGGAFHVTKPSALEGIILRGIVSGGNDSARRLAVHFVRSVCTLGQRKHLDQDCNARCQGGRRPHRHLRANKEIDRSLQRERAIWRLKSTKKGPVKDSFAQLPAPPAAPAAPAAPTAPAPAPLTTASPATSEEGGLWP